MDQRRKFSYIFLDVEKTIERMIFPLKNFDLIEISNAIQNWQ